MYRFQLFPQNMFLITLQTAIVIDWVQRALHVTMKMESATANQTFLVTSVTNVLMDSMGPLIVKVGFNYQCFLNMFSHIFHSKIKMFTLIYRLQL